MMELKINSDTGYPTVVCLPDGCARGTGAFFTIGLLKRINSEGIVPGDLQTVIEALDELVWQQAHNRELSADELRQLSPKIVS